MADFKALATKLVNQTFGEFAKTLQIQTIDGSCESGTAIDITNRFVVDGDENNEFVLVTDVDQWVKEPDAGNIDVVFDRTQLKILSVDKDAAQAAYFIKCITYERKTIIIESVVDTPDGQGGFTSVWSTFATIEAEVNYMDGSEAMEAGRLGISQMIKLYFRFEAGITEQMRVVFNGDNMPIRSVIDIGSREQWIELLVERDVAS